METRVVWFASQSDLVSQPLLYLKDSHTWVSPIYFTDLGKGSLYILLSAKCRGSARLIHLDCSSSLRLRFTFHFIQIYEGTLFVVLAYNLLQQRQYSKALSNTSTSWAPYSKTTESQPDDFEMTMLQTIPPGIILQIADHLIPESASAFTLGYRAACSIFQHSHIVHIRDMRNHQTLLPW